jgi:3-hydroxyisobutyrate dehydrogenase-like beta-hydroxyacid dehydrogenase
MSLNIGFIGPGIMGRPMALNLMKGGYKLWAYARRPETLQPLIAAGATACATPAEVAACPIRRMWRV